MNVHMFLIITCLALTLSTVTSLSIKIHLEKDSTERYQRHKRQSSCSDDTEVDRSNLTLPGKLNKLDQRVRFFRSEIARKNFDIFQNTTRVPLANTPTTYLRDILAVLRQKGCLPFFYGEAVRDQFLGRAPSNANVEIDCSIKTFYNICVMTWGKDNCGISSMRGHIGLQNSTGLERVDVASTDMTFYAPIYQLEYTVNSMAYDPNGNNVIIDLTATGEADVCYDKPPSIRIPSVDDSVASWYLWVTGTNRSALLPFWNLRVLGFVAWSKGTQTFIVNQAIRLIDRNPSSFGMFYCSNVYPGSEFVYASKICQASAQVCKENAGKATAYNDVLAKDFGSYWKNFIKPSLLPTCGSGVNIIT